MIKWLSIGTLFIHLNAFSQVSFQSSPNLLPNEAHFSGSVVGIADMNADGLDDIIRLGRSRVLSILYQNAPGKQFTEKIFGPIADYEFWNVAIADINKDGLNDMVFTANENPGFVYYSRKVGDSISFLSMELKGSKQAYAQAGNLVDINGDGWLDYFLCNDLGKNLIWANDSTGLLSDNPVDWIDFATVPSSNNSGNYGSVWSDLDNDGDLDLYIAKCKAGVDDTTDPRRINSLYQHQGQNKFVEIAASAGLAISDQSWVAVSGDSDNDGDQDLFIINHFAPCRLMINESTPGQIKFKDVTTASGINFDGIGVQAAWIDFDLDGKLDLMITGSKHQIYLNKGQNKFDRILDKELGINPIESFSFGDLNHDGKIDIYASYSKVFNEASGKSDEVWLNTSAVTNHFIKVRLEGVAANRSAVGARITVKAGGQKFTREIQSGISYGISTSLNQLIGIGQLTKIDSLIVQWPDQSLEILESPFIDRSILVKQHNCFGTDPILLKSPSKSILCGDQDSITLTIPLTGAYTWNTGQSTKSIVVKSAGQWQARIINAEGCVLYSNKVNMDKDLLPVTKIKVSDSLICAGSMAQLKLETNLKILWNTGAITPEIVVSTEGKYFATVAQTCGNVQSDTVQIRVLTPSPIAVKNDTVGISGKASLAVTGSSIFWFSNPEDTKPFHTGNTYLTPPLDKTVTYYVQSIVTKAGPVYPGGIKDFSGGSKFHANNFSGRLLFDVSRPVVLQSVKVYSDTSGTREITLINATGMTLASKLIRIEKGVSRVQLDFPLTVGAGFALGVNEETSIKIFGIKSPLLYRTEGAIPYPLTSGPITIQGTNAGIGNYYYFYDWLLSEPDLVCGGPRVPIMAVLKSTVPIHNELTSQTRIYPNPSRGNILIEFDDRLQYLPADVELFNNMGQSMFAKQDFITPKVFTIKDLGLKDGIYFLKINIGSKIGVHKILVAH